MGRARIALASLLCSVLLSGVASAHEVGGRFDAPVPLEWVYGAAAGTVAATALLLAVRGRDVPRMTERTVGGLPESVATVGIGIARAGFLAVVVLAVIAGLTGPRAGPENLATMFVWPVWLKGLVLVSAVVGTPWPILSPWRTVYDGLVRIEGEDIAVLDAYPAWLGVWPAFVGIVIWIGILANLTALPRSPRGTVVLIVGYTIVMLAGGIALGPRWFERADALAVLYRLFGRVAPIRFTGIGGRSSTVRIRLRWPWRGCLRPAGHPGVAAVAIAAVYTVSFDGFTSTPEYQGVLFTTRRLTGMGPDAGVGLYLLGLGLFLGGFVATVAVGDRLGGTANGWRAAVAAFAPTVLPIAAAYEIAHTYPFVLANLLRLPAVAGALVGPAGPPPAGPLAWVPIGAYWASQVVLIVGGHVVAVIAAHLVAAGRYDRRSAARRAEVPLTALMIAYTVLSLWIVSRPVAT